jgi:hypothetical protein
MEKNIETSKLLFGDRSGLPNIRHLAKCLITQGIFELRKRHAGLRN